MTYLVLAGMLVLVLFPVLIPAIITAVHAILGTNRPVETLGHLRPAVA
jgi:ABC-type transport system involved in cytochrome c biogenesis permease component